MRGLIRKDIAVFFKSMEKKVILVLVIAIVIVMRNGDIGVEAGLVTSVMMALLVGIQNLMGFVNDERVHWKQYQMAMPVSSFSVVASKYITVICSLGISLLGSMLMNLLASVIYHQFNWFIWLFSGIIAIVVPLLWTAVSLPLIYWFGFRAAQILSMVLVVPMSYFLKYFEDGPGFSALGDSVQSYVLMACIAAVLLFGVSMAVSVAGYGRKR